MASCLDLVQAFEVGSDFWDADLRSTKENNTPGDIHSLMFDSFNETNFDYDACFLQEIFVFWIFINSFF